MGKTKIGPGGKDMNFDCFSGNPEKIQNAQVVFTCKRNDR